MRFICTSHSTTIPRNPDWPLHYMFSFNGVNITDMTAETRYMAKDNELIIANLSKKDLPLEITCNVWEEDGLSSVHTSNFKLHVIEEIRC